MVRDFFRILQKICRPLIVFLLGIGFSSMASAQVDLELYQYPYNHLKWFTLESAHFKVIFQEGNSRNAQIISRIAEEIYGPITELYEHEPDSKVSIVLKDREDYSNGAAYFFDNKIDIWIPALDTPLRGTHNWLRNVISHEFTHIIQIQTAMKSTRRIPATYFQWLNYEDVRRPDVLYGYPNGVITFPFATVNVPAWMAEGTAQYQRASFAYDTWDAHRDMILRTRIVQNKAFSLDEMGSFSSKTSLERETLYNHGFGFIIWLSNRFGESVLKDISKALSQSGVQNVSEAIEIATGTDGYTLHHQWIEDLKQQYDSVLSEMVIEKETLIEEKGFFNFYPIKRPGTQQIAYLSNKGYDGGRLRLYFFDTQTGKTELAQNFQMDTQEWLSSQLACGLIPASPNVMGNSAFSFTDDGKKLFYSRINLNKYGEEYNDIFEFDLVTGKETQLSFSARLTNPVYVDKQRILALTTRDGTQNLVFLDTENHTLTPLTFFENGEQVFSPDWNEEKQQILFAFSDEKQREIRLLDISSGQQRTVLSDSTTDFRDPVWSNDDHSMLYAASPDGIFNIYRFDFDQQKISKLTSVQGGAFMPEMTQNGELVYSSYQVDGYKLAKKSTLKALENTGEYHPILRKESGAAAKDYSSYNVFDDTDLGDLPEIKAGRFDAEAQQIDIQTRFGEEKRAYSFYKDTFTQMSVYPIVRFDNYSTPNGSNGRLLIDAQAKKLAQNLWRDVKAGVYIAGREVNDCLSFYSGLLFGLGSLPSDGLTDYLAPANLVSLDRDLFFIAEYQGLPFIKRYWSPTISVELYNLRRNVSNGTSFEEFPCVSCLPDTTSADLAYDIWEADLFFRSKLNKFSMLELGLQYTPYDATIKSFYSKEYKEMLAASSSTYFIGKSVSLAYYLHLDEYHIHDDVAPLGFKGFVKYKYEPSRLLDNYQLEDGMLKPLYNDHENQSVEVNGRFGFKLSNQFFTLNSRFFSYLNPQKEYFYLDYIGGLTGMRSYPFFALGGSTTAYTTFSWNVPILTNLNKQVNRFTLDKLFLRLFAEAGNGWGGPLAVNNQLKTGLGAELRFSMNTNYLFPSKFFISGSYGLNEYHLRLPDEFISVGQTNQQRYGREWLFNFGLLFDFEL